MNPIAKEYRGFAVVHAVGWPCSFIAHMCGWARPIARMMVEEPLPDIIDDLLTHDCEAPEANQSVPWVRIVDGVAVREVPPSTLRP